MYVDHNVIRPPLSNVYKKIEIKKAALDDFGRLIGG